MNNKLLYKYIILKYSHIRLIDTYESFAEGICLRIYAQPGRVLAFNEDELSCIRNYLKRINV